MRVGFVGLGLMGSAMAHNIIKAGFPLTALTRQRRDALEPLLAEGAMEVSSGAALAENSDVVIICVTGSQQVREAMFQSGGIMDGAHPGLVVVDCTTGDPGFGEEAETALRSKGAAFLDAPVNRTPKEAREGRLNVLVGGDAEILARVRPVLESFSKSIHHLGAIGSGYRAKLVHNFIAQGNAVILAEAFATAAKVGLDLGEFSDVCRLSGAHSKTFDRIIPFVLEGDDSGQKFALRNAAKDMWSYAQLAATAGASAPVAEAVRQVYLLATNLGHGDDYLPHLFDVLGRVNGVSVRANKPPSLT